MIISGERFAFGYHYLRPNKTNHEPTRKFFQNKVFRIPIYEVLPLETIWQQCWVMDIPTFCKGRPIGSVEEHVYICEYRVDKKARLFDKIPKTSGKGKKSKSNDLSFCTKWFAFDMFDVRLKPSRNYAVSYLPILIATPARSDDTTFGVGTFSRQDPVHSWKAGPGVVMTVENLFYYMNQLATKCTFLVSENLMFTL